MEQPADLRTDATEEETAPKAGPLRSAFSVGFPHIARTSDASLNWAADTDPVVPVTPELALVDPGLAHGDRTELKMSSTQFGDAPTFDTADPAQAPVKAEHVPAPESIERLGPPAVAEPEAPLVAPVVAPAPATVPVPAEPPAAMDIWDMRDVPLGTLVFRAGLLPEEQLEEALQEGMKTGKRLGEILLERGWVSETDLARLLAGQKGLPFVDLDPSAIDPTAPPLLHPEEARLHGALPIGFQGGIPVVAVADPSNSLVLEDVRRALACEPVLVVAGRDALLRAIDESYGPAAFEPQAPPVQAEPVIEPAPAVEAAEPVAPVAPVVPAVGEQPQPAEEQPSEEDGLWLGLQPEPTEEPLPTPEPVAEAAAPVEPLTHEPQPVVEPEPEPEPVAAAPEPFAAPVSWAVVVRLADGERLEIGTFTGEDDAFEGARAVVDEIGSDVGWPFLAGRFIRPDSIVSVDLVEL